MATMPPHDSPSRMPETELLVRYLAGDLSPSEAEAFQRAYPKIDVVPDALEPVVDPDPDSAWARASAQLMEGAKSRRNFHRKGSNAYSLLLGGMAMVAILVLAYQQRLSALFTPARHVTEKRYATAEGQRASVILVDGSRVLLGPGTAISVITTTPDAGVDVRVVGQALFTVTHSPTRPFRVFAGHAVAQVLGTTFLVRQYPAERVTRVVVADGRVSLSALSGAQTDRVRRILTTSMLGMVNDSGQVQVTPHIIVGDYTGWASGHLVFRDTPAREAVLELGHAYGVELRIDDSVLAARPLTWTIPVAQQSLADVLESLLDVLDAHSVRTGRVITLVPGRSSQPRSRYPSSPSPSERSYGK